MSGKIKAELSSHVEVFDLPLEISAEFGSGDTIFRAQFGDISLGDILVYLVNKAEPDFDFKLSPPWDLLNQINLKNLALELDITKGRFGFRYDHIDFDITLVSIDAVEVWYSPQGPQGKGGNKSVDLSIYGTFLGKSYQDPPGLTWDVLNQPPPTAPGKGSKLFDLEYLGIGQHVTLRNIQDLDTLEKVILALEGSYKDVAPNANPLNSLPTLKFDSSSSWLFGLKFSVLETFAMSAVFNDPNVYGLLIALSGERAKSLAGFQFEILYRKVGENLGLYHIELKLPDALRTIQAGAATVTLPIVDIDIYTNANFLINLGFPEGLDFSRSFTIEFMAGPVPVIGRAGIYFGILDSKTDPTVPTITNGSFSPIIAFGFAISVGVGKTFNEGILSAGAYITFIGILEGRLGFFQPDSPDVSKAVYYRVEGTIAIVGHIYGKVNFAIISASVDFMAYASAKITFESHLPVVVVFEAGVSVSLRVKVVFVHIKLSFHTTIRETFTVGHATPSPWIVGKSSTSATPAAARMQSPMSARLMNAARVTAADLRATRAVGAALDTDSVLAEVHARGGMDWQARVEPSGGGRPQPTPNASGNMAAQAQPQPVSASAPSGKMAIDLYFRTPVTAGFVDDKPSPQANGCPTFGATAKQQVQLVGMLFIPSGDEDTGDQLTPFELLVQQALLWAVANIHAAKAEVTGQADDSLTLADLHYIYCQLTESDSPIDFSKIVAFLNDSVEFNIKPLLEDPTYTVLAGDTLADIARDHGVLITTLGEANAQTADLLLADVAIPLSTGAYQTKAGDTLQSIATDHTLTVDQVTAAAATVPKLLKAGTVIGGVQPVEFTVFPMMPFLSLKAGNDLGTPDFQVDFATETPCDDEYRQFLKEYFAKLSAPQEMADSDCPESTNQAAADAPPLSLAACIFTDYFVIILRSIIQDAIDLFESYPYAAQPDDSLPTIAQLFGLDSDDAPVDIAKANQNSSDLFAAGSSLEILAVAIPLQAGESIVSIARDLHDPPLFVADGIKNQAGVLRAGATIQIAGGSYTIGAGDTLQSIGAALGLGVEVLGAAFANVKNLLRPGTAITLPAGKGNDTVNPGDTLTRIATAQDVAIEDLSLAIASVPNLLVRGVTCALPPADEAALTYQVRADDTLQKIADRFSVTISGLIGTGENGSAPDLLVVGQIAKIGISVQVQYGESLKSFAGRFFPGQAEAIVEVATAAQDQIGLLAPGAALDIPPRGQYIIRHTDTLPSIAERFGTDANTLIAANPAGAFDPPQPPTGQPLKVGDAVVLPDKLQHTVVGNDTLRTIADHYGVAFTDLVTLNQDSTTLLDTLVTIQLPPITHAVQAGQTPLSIARQYDTTVADLLVNNPGGAGSQTQFQTVLVPDAATMEVDTALQSLTAGGKLNGAAGTVARFLLHGLRLPAPQELPQAGFTAAAVAAGTVDPANTCLYPMYTLTGQQWPSLVTEAARYQIELKLDAASGDVTPPTIYFESKTDQRQLQIELTDSELETVTGIGALLNQKQPPIDTGVLALSELPSYADVPLRFGFAAPIVWQAPEPPTYEHLVTATKLASVAAATTSPVAGTPKIYVLPDSLRERIDSTRGGSIDLDLVLGTRATPTAPLQTEALHGFGWVTRLDFGLRRASDPNRAGQLVPSVYEVFGASQEQTHDLQNLLQYLGKTPAADVEIQILYAANPASRGGEGLRSDVIDPATVLLLKANLSTMTRPPTQARLMALADQAPTEPPVLGAASMADGPRFLTLLWESSVVNTGGYYLSYRVDEHGLPDDLFNQDPVGTITVLVTIRPAVGSPATIPATSFHNALVSVDNVGTSDALLFVQPPTAAVPSGATLTSLATKFGVAVNLLGEANATTSNLLAPITITVTGHGDYQILPGDDLLTVSLATNTALDALIGDVATKVGLLVEGAEIQIHPEWVERRTTLTPGNSGFRLVRTDPDPAASDESVDSSQLGAQEDPAAQLAVLFNLVAFRLTGAGGFTRSAEGLPAGPAQSDNDAENPLPATAAGAVPWLYQKVLEIAPLAKPAAGAADLPVENPYAGLGTAAEFAFYYHDIYGNRILPNDAVGPLDNKVLYRDELYGLSQWPGALGEFDFNGEDQQVRLLLTVALDVGQYVTSPAASFSIIQRKARNHALRYAEVYAQLAQADVTVSASTTLDGQVTHALAVGDYRTWVISVHDYLTTVGGMQQRVESVTSGAALATIAANYCVTSADLGEANQDGAILKVGATLLLRYLYTVVQNDSLTSIAAHNPPSFEAITPAKVAASNEGSALQAGTVIRVGDAYSVTGTDTLLSIARAKQVLVSSLGDENAGLDALLVAGITIPLPSLTGTRTIEPGDTLGSIATEQEIQVAILGEANANLADLLVAETPIQLPSGPYTVQTGDTLGSIAAAHDLAVDTVAEAAQAVEDLLAVGTLINVLFWRKHVVERGDTMASVAKQLGCTVVALTEANKSLDGLLVAGIAIKLPNDQGAYTIRAGDTFASIAADQNVTVAALGEAVQDDTGLLTIGAQMAAVYDVQAGDRLGNIADAHQVTVARLSLAVAAVPGLLNAGSQLALGYAIRTGDTLAGLVARFGLPTDQLAEMNAAVQNLFASDEPLRLGETQHFVSETDTLASLARQYAVSVASIIELNAGTPNLLADDAALVVPYHLILDDSAAAAIYAVQENDTLAGIAHAKGVTVAALAEANADVDGLLTADQTVTFTYQQTSHKFTVKTNDTLKTLTLDFQRFFAAQPAITAAEVGVANQNESGLLLAGELMLIPPKEIAESIGPLNPSFPSAIFPVQAELVIQRSEDLVDPAFRDVPGVTTSSSLLAPNLYTSSSNDDAPADHVTAPQGLNDFAQRFQTSFKSLKLATGSEAAQETSITQTLTAVQYQSAVLKFQFNAKTPYFFAPTPISTRLWSSGGKSVGIRPYVSGQGLGKSVLKNFTGIDLDTWGREFLKTMDLVLSSEYAVAVYRLDQPYPVQTGDTLAQVATALGIAASDVSQLGLANADVPYLLNAGASITLPHNLGQATVAADDTLGNIADANGVNVGDLAAAAKDDQNLLAVDATLTAHGNYQNLVTAKDALAKAIRDRVAAVIQPAGSSPGIDLDAAKERLYQRLTISLSDAYKVDAIVQVPADVTAPSQWSGNTAPRLYGKPTGGTYILENSPTLQSVADHFQAPLDRLATTIAGAPFILSRGFPLQFPQQPKYLLRASDTLASVAKHFGTSVTDLAESQATTAGLLREGAALNIAIRRYTFSDDSTLGTAILSLALNTADDTAVDAAIDAFAMQNDEVPDILRKGITVAVYPQYATAETDTFESIALKFDTTASQVGAVNATLPGLLAPGKVIGVPSHSGDDGTTKYEVQPGDTLAGIAAAQTVTTAALVEFNATQTDLITKGVTITIPNPQTYTTVAGDRLTDIADRLGHEITPSMIVAAELETGAAVHPGTEVSLLTNVPGYSLSDTKLSLQDNATSPANVAPNITFLFESASNAAFGNISLDIDYEISNLEYDITDVSFATGYQASSWLSFVLPIQNPVGSIDIPIPLRSYPVPPSMESQAALPSYKTYSIQKGDTLISVADALRLSLPELSGVIADAKILQADETLFLPNRKTYTVQQDDTLNQLARDHATTAEVLVELNSTVQFLLVVGFDIQTVAASVQAFKSYDYVYSYTFQQAAQDELEVSWKENDPSQTDVGKSLAAGQAASAELLPYSLAQFSAISVALKQDLSLLTSLQPTGNDPGLENTALVATATLANLAAEIASGWSQWPLPGAVADVDPTFVVRQSKPAPGVSQVALQATNPAARMMAAAPRVHLAGQELVTQAPAAGDQMQAFRAAPTLTSSQVATAVGDDSQLDRHVVPVEGLNVIATQNIVGIVGVKRNTNLLPGAKTNPAFVYTVSDIKFANKAIPLFGVQSAFNMADVPAYQAEFRTTSLKNSLINFFAALLSNDAPGSAAIQPRNVGLAIDLGVQLAGQSGTIVPRETGITSRAPVFLKPTFLFDPKKDLSPTDGFCAELANYLESWQSKHLSELGTRQMWIFDVSLYTTFNNGSTNGQDSTSPLLQLSDVYYEIENPPQ